MHDVAVCLRSAAVKGKYKIGSNRYLSQTSSPRDCALRAALVSATEAQDEVEREEEKRLSKAAMETLAIIAYHQPVTRAEIEAIRGVGLSRGTIDLLLEIGWVRMRGRRRSPGRLRQ